MVYNTGAQTIGGSKTFSSTVNANITGNAGSVTDGVYLTGAQTIGGLKTFTNGLISNVGITGTNLVYNTGAQTISGIKTFATGAIFQADNNQLQFKTGSVGNTLFINVPLITANRTYTIPDVGDSAAFVLTTGVQTIGGVKTFTNGLISNVGITGTNLIYNTGAQTISGIKTFSDTGSFNTLEITNKKLSSYSYNSGNFTFSNNYLNLANSSNSLTGTLPNPIISGMNYYVKNLNTGVLMITGAGSRTIDGFANVSLYKNDSVQLLGVNNIGYTGWATISADGGIS